MSILNGWNGTYIISNTWNCQILGILDSKGSQFPQRCLFSSERRLISCKQSDAPMQTQRSIMEEKKATIKGYMMLAELHREMHGRVMPPAMKCLIIDASEEGTALTVRRDTYGCELHRLAQPSSLSWSSACLTSSLLFCNTIRLNASPRSPNCSRSQEPMQPPLTLSMAACSALSSTPEAAEDEAAAARQQRRGAEELAVVGATSTATIAMAPSPRGSAAADRQR